ncbi:hypothetical protein L484_026304 [Morus notabilis]|uniref:Uncharacterized protein n=1 Tax=Morus notabilis TaxID=981085 RepID=W9R6P6_9ROSA|nr:hypothetical protein L484_026304 [Morus notabilis]
MNKVKSLACNNGSKFPAVPSSSVPSYSLLYSPMHFTKVKNQPVKQQFQTKRLETAVLRPPQFFRW